MFQSCVAGKYSVNGNGIQNFVRRYLYDCLCIPCNRVSKYRGNRTSYFLCSFSNMAVPFCGFVSVQQVRRFKESHLFYCAYDRALHNEHIFPLHILECFLQGTITFDENVGARTEFDSIYACLVSLGSTNYLDSILQSSKESR